MPNRPVLIWPEPLLSQRAHEVTTVDATTRQLITDMFDTMYSENGIGLAANQIGVLQRVLVIDLDPTRQAESDAAFQAELQAWGFSGPQAFINPRIVASSSDTLVWEEGCLSVPGIAENVVRKAWVEVEALDATGAPLKMTLRQLYSVALQHELDHLNGKVFVEHLSRLKREGIKRKMVRLKQDGPTAPPPHADELKL